MDCAYTFQLNTDTIILDGIFLCLRCSSYSELGSRFAVDTPSAVVLHSVAYNISLTTIYVDARSLLITFNGVADDFRIGIRIEQRNAIAGIIQNAIGLAIYKPTDSHNSAFTGHDPILGIIPNSVTSDENWFLHASHALQLNTDRVSYNQVRILSFGPTNGDGRTRFSIDAPLTAVLNFISSQGCIGLAIDINTGDASTFNGAILNYYVLSEGLQTDTAQP